MKSETWVWDDYEDGRRAFITSAKTAGAALSRRELPGYCAPSGAPLSMDSARLGPREASKLVLCLSGVHGFEGPAGSAVQSDWLRAKSALPSDTAVLLIHAVNPYGYAWKSRSTEDNVDLNRAFVDRHAKLPENPGYGEVHRYLCPAEVNAHTLSDLRTFLARFEHERGPAYANSAVGAGQYSHPDGLYYGGVDEPWSVSALTSILREQVDLSFVKDVAFVDFHTGRGPYAEPFYLCFDPSDSVTFQNAARWWGRDALLSKDELGSKYEGEGPPPRTGLLFHGVRRILEPATVSGCVVEFGTFELWTMYEAELLDRWVRFKGRADDLITQEYREKAFRAFCPSDPAWRDGVLGSGPEILTRALYGVGHSKVEV